MVSGLTVRVVQPAEFDAVGELVVAAYNAIPGAVPDPDYDEELRRVAERAAMVPVLVAVDALGRMTGSLTYVPGPGPFAALAGAGEAEIRMFAVAPAAQGAGVGRVLLDTAIRRATAERRTAVVLSTSPWMSAAQRLYRSHGFVRRPSLDRSEPSSGTTFELWAYRLDLVDDGASSRDLPR